MKQDKPDVLISGGGPVGLFAALACSRAGMQVEVMEEEWRTTKRSYALALHPATLELFFAYGLSKDLLEAGYSVDKLVLYDGSERSLEINIRDLPCRFPHVLVVPQQTLEQFLIDRLSHEGVSVRFNHRLGEIQTADSTLHVTAERLGKDSFGYGSSSSGWVVEKTLQRTPSFLIGADGHMSQVRNQLGIGFSSVGDSKVFAVFEFETDRDPGNEVVVRFSDMGSEVLWPVASDRVRWSFELEPEADAKGRGKSRHFIQDKHNILQYMTNDYLQEQLSRRMPWFDGSVGEIFWSVAVRFEQRMTERFGAVNVGLVGDAAHLTLPIGVQSMNIGFLEAADLADRFADASGDQRPFDPGKEYDPRWRQYWQHYFQMGETWEPGPDAPAIVRKFARQIPYALPAGGQELEGLLEAAGFRRI